MRKPSKQIDASQQPIKSSFRDPVGYIYQDKSGTIRRRINQSGFADYDHLMSSGLYDELVKRGLLVPHTEVASQEASSKIIEPLQLPFISYPFEWSFSQLQDAAILTLTIQKIALKHGMTLKDASAYNIQFHNGKPLFIDTLSFEKYTAGQPWQAYRQFCEHFLAPLSLMSYVDASLLQLLRVHIDGIPLQITAKLLPSRAKLKPGIAMHVAMHAKAQKSKESVHESKARTISSLALEGILDSLLRTVKKLQLPSRTSEWGDYYSITNYSDQATEYKKQLVAKMLQGKKVMTALDLGGNNGSYSRVLNENNIFTVCADIDPNAVENNYQTVKKHKESLMLPLLVDLTNPAGALGWANAERDLLHERLQTDVVVALALIHHLAISNNLPFNFIADYFSKFAPLLLIEFVPKGDSQVNKLLSTRKDIFDEYDEAHFEKALLVVYNLEKRMSIKGTSRTLYLFKRK